MFTYITKYGNPSFYPLGNTFTRKQVHSIPIFTNIRSQQTTRQISCLRNDGKIDLYAFPHNGIKQKLLTGIADSWGIVTEIDYQFWEEHRKTL